MNDTPEHVERRYQQLLMKLTPERRLRLASEMFATARRVMRDGIRLELGAMDEAELRVQMFVRLYGEDFSPARRAGGSKDRVFVQFIYKTQTEMGQKSYAVFLLCWA